MPSRNTGVSKVPSFLDASKAGRRPAIPCLLVFGSETLPHGVRSTVLKYIDGFMKHHGLQQAILLLGDGEGVEAYATDYALQHGMPRVVLHTPRKGGREARDWIAVQACDMALGFSEEEGGNDLGIVQLLRAAGKPTEFYVLGDRGFEIKPWFKKHHRE